MLLELYTYGASVYYDKKATDYDLFLKLMKLTCENLSVKMVHIFGSVWKIMVGMMPSGAFETSHGNSWIVQLLWWSYCEYVIYLHPEIGEAFEKAFLTHEIEAGVYGDDHNLALRDVLTEYINEVGYAAFVAEFWGMEITEPRECNFISVPNDSGNLKYRGVAWLKKYFILRTDAYPNNLPDVLPYKRLDDALVKFAWGNSERYALIDQAIACIGLAYDNMGVNAVAHEMLTELFTFCIQKMEITNMNDLRFEFFKFDRTDKKDITKIMGKTGIPVDTVFQGFPTREKLLQMHVYDENYVNFTPKFGRYSVSHQRDWEKAADPTTWMEFPEDVTEDDGESY